MSVIYGTEWIRSPVCGSKTRDKIREDTVLKNYPLYWPKCKQETLIEVTNLQITVITEPDLFLKFGGFFMFFFRAVIHLLMQCRIYTYIAYRGLAGSQLKKSLLMQRCFSP